jgi:hypothetical protein
MVASLARSSVLNAARHPHRNAAQHRPPQIHPQQGAEQWRDAG